MAATLDVNEAFGSFGSYLHGYAIQNYEEILAGKGWKGWGVLQGEWEPTRHEGLDGAEAFANPDDDSFEIELPLNESSLTLRIEHVLEALEVRAHRDMGDQFVSAAVRESWYGRDEDAPVMVKVLVIQSRHVGPDQRIADQQALRDFLLDHEDYEAADAINVRVI